MKDYKKILENVVNIINTTEKSDIGFANICTYIGENCPELKESEDERIRRDIIRYLKKTSPAIGENIEKMLAWLEKQGEQKPIDKVEPKFHEGEWIISKYMHLVMQILNNDNGSYKTLETDGTERNDSYDFIERNFKLWTIQDAKDGDVLAESKGDVILMFRGIGNARWDDVIDYHFYYDCYRENFIVQEDVNYWGNTENNQLKPATKEQRDILFQKMREASYEWDAEKKELKKINSYCQENCKGFQEIGKCFTDGECKAKREAEQKPTNEEMKTLLRTEYEKGKADAIAEIQNPAWSKEDESYLNTTIAYLKDAKEFKKTAENCMDWLKSLKDRV